ncbi:MAG: hypothetical protein HYX38_16585 [Rhodospirillales bacterium]|nr:hypothetical protein [Rhodospirillales bacterium]
MFQLLHDKRHNVLLTRLSGTLVVTDVSLRDKAVGRFVARNGLARGIMDYTAVEAVDIPIEVVVERSSKPPLLPGQARVIVAPREPLWAINRIFAAHQLFRQGEEPLLVRSIEEAYQALFMVDPVFEPVAVDRLSRLEGVTHDVLAGIESSRSGADAEERQRLRRKMLRMLDTVLERGPAARKVTAITLSDVLNAMLGRATVSDSDLKTTCTTCKSHLPLSRYTISAGRETTYACPGCGQVVVVLAAADEGAGSSLSGYEMGRFIVRTASDIECPGAMLPKCEP